VAFVLVAIALPRSVEIIPGRGNFIDFPMSFNGWTGQPAALESVYLDQLKLDDYLLADYSDNSGRRINLYMSYYNSQRKGDAVHSPRACLPGGGWQMHDFDQREIPAVQINGHPLRVNRTLIELGEQRELVYYWFQQRGRIITNEFAVKGYMFWDAITRHRTDGAMIRIIAPLPPGADESTVDRELSEFAFHIAPKLPGFIPN
jgi:EpsI family protein